MCFCKVQLVHQSYDVFAHLSEQVDRQLERWRDTLEVDPNWLRPEPPGQTAAAGQAGLAEVERRTILEALERSGGKIYGPGGAAAALGLKPTTLYGKMRKLGIAKGQAPR